MFRIAKIHRPTFLLVLLGAAANTAALDLVGYLPYYRLSTSYISNVLPGQLTMLDEVRYFGLTVDSNGAIVPLSGSLQSHMDNIATIQGVIDLLPESERPRLDVTLGAAGQDATFTAVAANAAKRDVLAQNVSALLNDTGAAGVDIDWEHPDAGVQRSNHYPAMLRRIKQEVGAEHLVYATVAPSVVISNSVFSGPDAIDGVSLMTYDLGWWSGDPSNPNNGEHALQEYAEDTIKAWTDPSGSQNDRPWVFGTWGNDAPADSLGLALPFYGRATSNQTAYTYSELVAGSVATDGEYYTYRGQQVWGPSPELAAERVELAIEHGLQHLIFWEIGQDLLTSSDASLLRKAYEARQAIIGLPGDFNGDGVVDGADYTVWRDGGSPDSSQAGYDQWVGNYGAPKSDSTATFNPVPEPVSIVMLGLGGLAATRRSSHI